MRLWNWIRGIFTGNDQNVDPVIDHVKVKKTGKKTPKSPARTRTRAEERHGKPFRCDMKAERTAPKSPRLMELEALSSHKSNVVNLKKVQ